MGKICTDLEQSRKLLSLGIDKNTADMRYFSDGYNPTKLDVGYSAEDAKFYRGTKNEYIPAWSLTALVKLTLYGNLAFGDKGFWMVYNGKKRIASQTYDEPIDAVFEMVCWLLENGYIKKV